MSWDPSRYLQFEDARLRPALELLARVPAESPRQVVDLGCGAGNVMRWLAHRWPEATILGVDADEAMLAAARVAIAGEQRIDVVRADLAAWRPATPPDVLYSNAALHWLDGHEALFRRLVAMLAARGVLAVQMPDNFRAPSHRELYEVARAPRWRATTAALVRRDPVHAPSQYYDWLAPAAAVDVWTTEYLQRLPARADNEHPVVAWMRGSALIPFVGALGDAAEAFVADYAARVERAYPRRGDGSVLFAFRRLFIVATR